MTHYHAAVSEFIKQLPALLGLVIGALGSYVVVMRGDRARFRREQGARWQERRLAAYSDYALTLKKTVTLNRRVAAHLGHDGHRQPLPPDDAAPLLDEAADARSPAGEGLLMLGSPEVVDAAHLWALTVVELEPFSVHRPVPPTHGRPSLRSSAWHGRSTTRRSVATWNCRPATPADGGSRRFSPPDQSAEPLLRPPPATGDRGPYCRA